MMILAPWCLLLSSESGFMVSPSGTRGAGSTKVRAGRRQTLGCEPDLITWPPLATCPDALRARISRCRVARELPFNRQNGGYGMRIIGLDIHRAFAEAVAWKDSKLSRLGRVIMRREQLEEFAKQLSNSDIVVIEATGNAASVAAVLGPHVSRVVIANPKQVRLIAHAKIKTDKIDAAVLAQLYASGFLPEVWIADDTTQALRRQVTRRNQIVRQRSRLKNIMQSILHAHLIPSCPHQDLCGPMGRAWLCEQILPGDERLAVERHLREFDRLTDDLKVIERDLAQSALADDRATRLMTIPGINMVVALALIAAIAISSALPKRSSWSAISG